jgi:hypothetical protein
MVLALLGLGALSVGVGCLVKGGLGFFSGGGDGALGIDTDLWLRGLSLASALRSASARFCCSAWLGCFKASQGTQT